MESAVVVNLTASHDRQSCKGARGRCRSDRPAEIREFKSSETNRFSTEQPIGARAAPMPETTEQPNGDPFNGKKVFLLTIALAPPIAGIVVGVAIVIWSFAATTLEYSPFETPHAPALLGIIDDALDSLAAGFAYFFSGLRSAYQRRISRGDWREKARRQLYGNGALRSLLNAPFLLFFETSFAAGAFFFIGYFLAR
ncbi:MAG: hypothetical protein R3C54_06625 [Parvularculaceae bacterium]